MYTLDEMIRIFEENAEMAAKENEKALEDYKLICPGQPIPDWFTRDFCINTALAFMCKEIKLLKEYDGFPPNWRENQ